MAKRSFLLAGLILATLSGCGQVGPNTLYQVSTLQALQMGQYEGVVSCGTVRSHGDLGVGTFEDLDGELILIDGQIYRAPASGQVARVGDREKVPFAEAVKFQPQQRKVLPSVTKLEELTAGLDRLCGGKNLFYAARIDGTFDFIKVRSVPRQHRPYPRLAEVTKNQATFEYRHVTGTIVAFRYPDYAAGINMPSWHLHFISQDRKAGGHLLEASGSNLRAALDAIHRLDLELPTTAAFATAELGKENPAELKAIER